ncbi:hypothetical protein DES49_2665 [Halospina denitrificans]|uniref:Uncharacterized protein n=1 Tax=Halospina denitrificans TaxID=332522 RepID=A0A4V3EPF6_9GAMM|nr:hypothetical protein DES49_2665 [Halospina denitrificans]
MTISLAQKAMFRDHAPFKQETVVILLTSHAQ